MKNEITNTASSIEQVMENVIIKGDLSQLQPKERVQYYNAFCKSLGLNPVTRPFEYITLNGKLTLYCKKDGTEQLASARNISLQKVGSETIEGVYIVTAEASTPRGRTSFAIGAVAIAGLKGDALANALMKAETKAKRRATLSICGLGTLDESELETIPGAIRNVIPGTDSKKIEHLKIEEVHSAQEAAAYVFTDQNGKLTKPMNALEASHFIDGWISSIIDEVDIENYAKWANKNGPELARYKLENPEDYLTLAHNYHNITRPITHHKGGAPTDINYSRA